MNLYDLLDAHELDEMIAGGYVREQKHPSLPLRILNYTPKAAYDEVWNPTTLTCRGLIYRQDSQDLRWVVARPFPKFFNYGQPGCPDIHLDWVATVTEKLDGSLGILYPQGADGWAVATRGSFTSDQALHATRVLHERYGDWFPVPGVTFLFEIVYPENRIVLDYGDTDDLFLLAMLSTRTGERVFHEEGDRDVWPGPVVDTHPYRSMAEALAAEPRPNAEGLVVAIHTGGPDVLVKIKQEDYVALHRIVTGLNKRTVWQHLDQGLPIEDLVAPLPDEFKPWVEDVVAELSALVAAQSREIEAEFRRICDALYGTAGYTCEECGGELAWVTQMRLDRGTIDVGLGQPDPTPVESTAGWACTTAGGCSLGFKTVIPPRRPFAEYAKDSPWSWALFLRLDGRDYSKKLWHLAKPDPVGPAGRTFSEDTA